MMNGGEAADQMVSYAFKGGEVVLRLSGSAAKNLAVYLANVLKEGGPSKGKTTLKRMIADGKELSVQRIAVDQIPYFNEMAKKYGVMFVAIRDKQQKGGTCDIMFRTEDAARVNRIFDRLAISEHPDVAHIRSEIQRERGENGQPHGAAENPTRAARSSPSGSSSPARGETGNERPSVRAQLRELRNARMEKPAVKPTPVKAPRTTKKTR